MKKSLKIFNPPVLLFKRWSRKSYSAFVSMNRVVNICRLAVHVADPLVGKTNNFHKIVLSDLSVFAFMAQEVHDVCGGLGLDFALATANAVPLSETFAKNINHYNHTQRRIPHGALPLFYAL
jgi:hypothetical protein